MDLCVHSVGTDVVSVRVGKLLADGHKVRPYGAVRAANLAERSNGTCPSAAPLAGGGGAADILR